MGIFTGIMYIYNAMLGKTACIIECYKIIYFLVHTMLREAKSDHIIRYNILYICPFYKGQKAKKGKWVTEIMD